MDKKMQSYLKQQFIEKYGSKGFNKYLKEYQDLADFKINENVGKVGGISEEAHFIMRKVAQYYLIKTFEAMKIDMKDPNIATESGTPYRIIKMWTGNGLDDDTELMSGRWANKPRLAVFPNESDQKFPITKRIDVISVCSHHAAPFSTKLREDSYAIVSYIPDEHVLGISKLQRIVRWVAQRGWLQEDLTKAIYDEVSKAAQTKSVYVELFNVVHTCEFLRGSHSVDGAFSSVYYDGDFNDVEIRKMVIA